MGQEQPGSLTMTLKWDTKRRVGCDKGQCAIDLSTASLRNISCHALTGGKVRIWEDFLISYHAIAVVYLYKVYQGWTACKAAWMADQKCCIAYLFKKLPNTI